MRSAVMVVVILVLVSLQGRNALCAADHPVRVTSGGQTSYYGTLGEAFGAAAASSLVEGVGYPFPESLSVARTGLEFRGGFDDSFSSRPDTTCLTGPLTVAGGSLTVDRMALGCDATGADLESLVISSGTLAPAFTPSVVDYALGSGDVTLPLSVTATTSSPDATLTINGAPATSGAPFVLDSVDKSGDTVPVVVRSAAGSSKTYNLRILPPDFPRLTVTAAPGGTRGHIFLCNIGVESIDMGGGSLPSPSQRPYLMILDNNGVPVRYQKVDLPVVAGLDFKVLGSDRLHAYLTPPSMNEGAHLVLDRDLATLESRTIKNYAQTDPHEFVLRDNGNVLMFSYNERRVDLRDVGGSPLAIVLDLIIQEQDPAGAVVWEWSSQGRLDPHDATADIDLTVAPPDKIDYVHGNSMVIDTDGNLIVSCRHQDQIIKIDYRNGGGSGDIIWRLEGLGSRTGANDFTWLGEEEDKFSHQHYVRRLANGNLLFFDNGNLRFAGQPEKQYSRAVEYRIKETVPREIEKVWQYRNPDPATPSGWTYSPCMGSVQRFANGNTVIGWGGTAPALVEVDGAGNKLLELRLPTGSFSYRALKFTSW